MKDEEIIEEAELIEPTVVVDQRDVTATIVALVNQANSLAEGSSSTGTPVLYDVQDASTYIDETDQRSDAARRNYEELKGMKKAHWYTVGRNKAKVEKTQDVLEDIIDAVDNNANATKALFNTQARMSEFSKKLYLLGLMSVASNRMVVREITMRLEHASKEELSDLARRELETVLTELKRQQSLENRVDKLETKLGGSIKKHDELSRHVEDNQTEVLAKIGAIDKAVNSSKEQLESKLVEADKKRDELTRHVEDNQAAVLAKIGATDEAVKSSKEQLEAKLVEADKKRDELSRHVEDNQAAVLAKIGATDEAVKSSKEQLEAKLNEADEKCDELAKQIDENYKALLSSSDTHNKRLDLLEKKSLFDSTVYKVLVGIAALCALILSLLTFLG